MNSYLIAHFSPVDPTHIGIRPSNSAYELENQFSSSSLSDVSVLISLDRAALTGQPGDLEIPPVFVQFRPVIFKLCSKNPSPISYNTEHGAGGTAPGILTIQTPLVNRGHGRSLYHLLTSPLYPGWYSSSTRTYYYHY
jgi:hypothetical protein